MSLIAVRIWVIVPMPASAAAAVSHDFTVCSHSQSGGTVGFSDLRSMVDAAWAKPQRLGNSAATTSRAPRSVTVIKPPQNTNCAMIVMTNAGIVCSPVPTRADSSNPSRADTNEVPKAASHNSKVGSAAQTEESGLTHLRVFIPLRNFIGQHPPIVHGINKDGFDMLGITGNQ